MTSRNAHPGQEDLNQLIGECQRIPWEGIVKSEPLSNLSGAGSRRIDDANRFVHTAEDNAVYIAVCRFTTATSSLRLADAQSLDGGQSAVRGHHEQAALGVVRPREAREAVEAVRSVPRGRRRGICDMKAVGKLLKIASPYLCSSRSDRLGFQFRNALAQCALFLEANRLVTYHRDDAGDLPAVPVQQRHGESNRHRIALLVDRRDLEQIMAIASLACCHGLVVAFPVARAQPLGNDQVKRLAQGLFLGKAEHVFGGGVPQGDRAVGAGDDDGVADGGHQLFVVDSSLHGHS